MAVDKVLHDWNVLFFLYLLNTFFALTLQCHNPHTVLVSALIYLQAQSACTHSSSSPPGSTSWTFQYAKDALVSPLLMCHTCMYVLTHTRALQLCVCLCVGSGGEPHTSRTGSPSHWQPRQGLHHQGPLSRRGEMPCMDSPFCWMAVPTWLRWWNTVQCSCVYFMRTSMWFNACCRVNICVVRPSNRKKLSNPEAGESGSGGL